MTTNTPIQIACSLSGGASVPSIASPAGGICKRQRKAARKRLNQPLRTVGLRVEALHRWCLHFKERSPGGNARVWFDQATDRLMQDTGARCGSGGWSNGFTFRPLRALVEAEEAGTSHPVGEFQCPNWRDPHGGSIIGCGSMRTSGPDDEGMCDCYDCGIFFKSSDTREMAIAMAFAKELAAELNHTALDEIDSINASGVYGPGVCASHDFCDANEFMAEAFEQVMGREINLQSEADCALWSRSWNLATETGFLPLLAMEGGAK